MKAMTKTLEISCDNNIIMIVKLYECEGRSKRLAAFVETSNFHVAAVLVEAWCRDKWSATDSIAYVRGQCANAHLVKREVRL